MPFAPHEIENKKFVVALRGYQTGEVDAFLRAVAADYRAVLETARLAQEAAADPPVIADAEAAAAEIRRQAEEEARAIREAAQREAEAVYTEIDKQASELHRIESDLRLRLGELERAVAAGVRAVGGTAAGSTY